MGEVFAWTCLPRDGRVRMPLPDGTRLLVSPGIRLSYSRAEEMRAARLHGWLHVLDALWHSRGLVICRAYLTGQLLYGRVDGAVWSTEFTALWVGDATSVLLRYLGELSLRMMHALRTSGVIYDSPVREAIAAQQKRLDGQMEDVEYELYYDEVYHHGKVHNINNALYGQRFPPVTDWIPTILIGIALWGYSLYDPRLPQYVNYFLKIALVQGTESKPGLGLTVDEMNGEVAQRLTAAFAPSEERRKV